MRSSHDDDAVRRSYREARQAPDVSPSLYGFGGRSPANNAARTRVLRCQTDALTLRLLHQLLGVWRKEQTL